MVQQKGIEARLGIVFREVMEKYCLNCGHDCHCGGNCMKEYDKGTKIICCTHCRHDKVENKQVNNEDLFNGA